MFSPLHTLSMIYLHKRPFILNHKINISCDCRCRFCDSWRIGEGDGKLMTLAEIESMLGRARAAGMLSYSAWGGEPLLREDAPEIMAGARKLGFFTTISTNGSKLAERARELIPHVSIFLVSLDGVGATHDRVRGCPGLFERVTDGIRVLRREGGRARLYFNVNLETMTDIEAAAGLAKELKVSIFYFPMVRFEGYNDRIALSREAEKDAFERVLDLKRRGFPVVNLTSYLKVIRDGQKTRCRFPLYHLYVDFDGAAYTCDLGPENKLAVWGDVRSLDLKELFSSEKFRDKTRSLIDCNACRLSCGEIGSGSPLPQFPVRALARARLEWLSQSDG